MKVTGYSAGSIYKRFYGSNMSRMNRAAVENVSSALTSYGTTVFSTNLSQVQGLSELAAKQYAARITSEAQATLQGASGITSLLQSLGATTDTSA